jgi:hypothetical protein
MPIPGQRKSKIDTEAIIADTIGRMRIAVAVEYSIATLPSMRE